MRSASMGNNKEASWSLFHLNRTFSTILWYASKLTLTCLSDVATFWITTALSLHVAVTDLADVMQSRVSQSQLELKILSNINLPPQFTAASYPTSLNYGFRSCRPLLGRQGSSELLCRGCVAILTIHVCMLPFLQVSWLLPYRQKDKLYAHHVGQASWAGTRIIQEQWTPKRQGSAISSYSVLALMGS
jgi:hypothetical protein